MVERNHLTCPITRLLHFIHGGGVQIQADWPIVSCDKVKGGAIGGGHNLQIIRYHTENLCK